MNEVIVINGQSVEFEVVNSRVFTTSLNVANVFEKRHDNIIAQIRALPNDEFRYLNFKETERTAKFGAVVRSEPYYKISRDGFSLLVMGFTGQKAYRWKIEFIAAFNKMESLIKRGGIANEKFTEVLTALSQKSSEADEYKNKYYATLERENLLLRQKMQSATNYNRWLNDNERVEILRLYKEGLSQAQICRVVGRSENAVKKVIRGAL